LKIPEEKYFHEFVTHHYARAQKLVRNTHVFSVFFASSKGGSVLAFPAHVSLGEKNETR
jgi:hypothetical protein